MVAEAGLQALDKKANRKARYLQEHTHFQYKDGGRMCPPLINIL